MAITPVSNVVVPIEYITNLSPAAGDVYVNNDNETSTGIAADQNRVRDHIKDAITGINDIVDDLNASLTSMDNSIAGVVATMGSYSGDIGSINASFDTINGDISTLQSDVGALELKHTNVTDPAIANLQAAATAMSDSQGVLTVQIGALQTLLASTTNIYVYGYYDSLDHLPASYAAPGAVIVTNSDAIVIGSFIQQLAPNNNWIQQGVVAYEATDPATLPGTATELEYAFVTEGSPSQYNIYQALKMPDESIEWYQTFSDITYIPSDGVIPELQPTENCLAYIKVDHLVEDVLDLPLSADEYIVYAIDASGSITASTVYNIYKNGSWSTLDYIPGYLMYAYHSSVWNRIGEHPVS